MRSPIAVTLLALAGAGVLWLLSSRAVSTSGGVVARRSKPPTSPAPATSRVTLTSPAAPMAPGSGVLRRSGWVPPAAAAAYLPAIRTAELANRLPDNLLARVLYQESRYRPDIISGAVKSSAGALGIAQIIPRYHPGVNPLDPFASITYAARFLADLKRRLGSWDKALAGYNWGQGNVARYATSAGWLDNAPLETRRYVEEILRDVPAALPT